MNKRGPNHREAYSVIQVRREDKLAFDKIKDELKAKLGFHLSFTQAFGILIKHTTPDQLLKVMASVVADAMDESKQREL